MHLNEIKRVLISVTDKKGIVEFAQGLKKIGRASCRERV